MSVDESGVSDIGMGLGWLHGQGMGALTKVRIYPQAGGEHWAHHDQGWTL